MHSGELSEERGFMRGEDHCHSIHKAFSPPWLRSQSTLEVAVIRFSLVSSSFSLPLMTFHFAVIYPHFQMR